MSVTIPRTDGVDSHTVFKGSQKSHNKECVLIIDETTGEITLERLYSNIQVKQTRGPIKHASGTSSKTSPHLNENSNERISPTDGRNHTRTKVVSGKKKEPSHQLPPPKKHTASASISTTNGAAANSPKHKSLTIPTFSSLPLLSDDDDIALPPASRLDSKVTIQQAPSRAATITQSCSLSETSDSDDNEPGQSSSSSSSSSSKASPKLANFTMPDVLLNEDLQLSSDSSSDSDS